MLQSKIGYPWTSKWKDCMQLWKACLNLWLVAAPFQMARMKIMPSAGRRRGSQLGAPSGATFPSQEEMRKWESQLRGLEVAGRSLGLSPSQLLTQMVAEVGPSMSIGETSHSRQEGPLQRVLQGGWRGTRGTGQGQWLSVRHAGTRRVLSSSSISGHLHA